MAFSIAQFKQVVDQYGGDGMVISLMFNNAYVRTFDYDETFDRNQHLDEANEFFIMTEVDTRGVPYRIVKPIEYLEGIVFAFDQTGVEQLDRRYIRT